MENPNTAICKIFLSLISGNSDFILGNNQLYRNFVFFFFLITDEAYFQNVSLVILLFSLTILLK